jgi:biopolymer transport protein ExbB
LVLLGVSSSALGQDVGDAAVIGTATLPRDLTPWGMFLNADPIVKGVLIGLLFASVVTWTVWLAKTIEIFLARRRVRSALTILPGAASLSNGDERLSSTKNEIGRFLAAAVTELRLSPNPLEREGIKERIASRLERLEASFSRRISRGTGVLATIGSTAPFVGLFGTVWGIMNSFAAIAASKNTSLAVVAPGIAEALFATALGLVAAIPAVLAYNKLSGDIGRYGYRLEAFAGEFNAILSRQLEERR